MLGNSVFELERNYNIIVQKARYKGTPGIF